MSKTHKITQLKKRIVELEKMLKEIPSLEKRITSQRRDIVELKNVCEIDIGNLGWHPSEEYLIARSVCKMFDIHKHPELANLFTFTEYVSRVNPMNPRSEIHAFEIKCEIVKPKNYE